MTQVVDGRNDQMLEDSSFVQMLAEQPVDNESVLDQMEQPGEDAGDEEQPAGRETARHEGTDVVLERLEQDDPEAARVMRGMQQNMSRMQNEWNDLRSQTIDTLMELERLREGGAPAEEAGQPEGLPEGVTPEHLDMFRKMADHFGYVPREELEDRAVEQEMDTHALTAMQRGVELYGDSFGTKGETGEIQVNPEVREELASLLERMEDPKRGITLLDLYQLRYGPPAAQQQRRSPAQGAPQTAQPQRPRSGVARRSTGGGQQLKIYDPKRGDTPDMAFDRAWALARKELGA